MKISNDQLKIDSFFLNSPRGLFNDDDGSLVVRTFAFQIWHRFLFRFAHLYFISKSHNSNEKRKTIVDETPGERKKKPIRGCVSMDTKLRKMRKRREKNGFWYIFFSPKKAGERIDISLQNTENSKDCHLRNLSATNVNQEISTCQGEKNPFLRQINRSKILIRILFFHRSTSTASRLRWLRSDVFASLIIRS